MNEEAIKGLKKLRSFHNGSYGEHIDMAIKALEEQPCEDCISRDSLNDAISELTYWHFEDGRLVVGGDGRNTVYKVDDVTRLVHVLPSVTPQTRWIPVNERLPEFTADYKVTVGINYDGGGMFPEVRTALYNKVYKCWVVHESDRAIVGDVIAWMPLPEPYKECEADDE